ncbi:helix-turn-helix transcriptional regulator [Piscinibacter sakaiensis]|uniref:Transcriptional regulator, AraC family n=1 Tax=Piscinibacter sakaiensis TaxID=1547922 RepID=A0A0K8P072_PISS1|nr:helix-turn-helix transcriptional regulator [Piscinibacter sakaiensis]GAP36028.1 transcriptional regulator, AraC family [Piscinibacter sakaiensis]
MPKKSPRLIELKGLSAEELEKALRVLYAPLRIAPLADPLQLELLSASSDGITHFQTQCNGGVVFEGQGGFDGYNFAHALAGSQQLRTRDGRVLTAQADETLVSDGLEIDSVRLSHGMALRGLSIAADHVHRRIAELTDAPLSSRVQFEVDPTDRTGRIRAALALGDALAAGIAGAAPLKDSPLALANLREAIVHLVIGVPSNYSDRLTEVQRPKISPAYVRRAIEYMHANRGVPITVTDIARAAGVSPRALQWAFQKFHGTTPLVYLRRLRLEAVREDLLAADPPASVAEIATRWGFVHMGLFAQRYRQAFGETPSQTLKRRRG